MYPNALLNVIDHLKKFDGMGEKSAERMALQLIEKPLEEVEQLSNSILELKQKITRCKNCGYICETDECSICSNKNRNDNLICVVEEYKSVVTFEKTGNYDGKYHVLNGVISPIDGITPDDLNIDSLIKRIDSINGDKEVIIALKPSIEGETTTLYLKKILEGHNTKVSRLSYGIPMGVEIDYLDSITLDRALKDRKDI